MISPIERIKSGSRRLTERDICDIHDRLMVEYGWIPLEEFRKLPLPTLWSLLDCIERRKEREEQELKKAKK